MASYIIINSTAAEFTNVNVGGDDVAAHTISGNLVLTDAELAIVCALNGAAVMQTAASAAEKAAVGNELLGGGAGAAPGVSYVVANASGAELTNITGTTDIVDGTDETVTLTGSELLAAIANDGVVALKASSSNEERRKVSKILRLGFNPGAAT